MTVCAFWTYNPDDENALKTDVIIIIMHLMVSGTTYMTLVGIRSFIYKSFNYYIKCSRSATCPPPACGKHPGL